MSESNNESEEGFELEYLSKLNFYDDFFIYRDTRYKYADVSHIQFTAVATRHSVNFIPTGTTYEASLFLHFSGGKKLQIEQETRFLRRKDKNRSEAVMRAASIFRDLTFNQRVEVYERTMLEKGFVSWGKHQITKNGDLYRNNVFKFNILGGDVSFNLGPFHVECRKKKPGLGDRLKELWSGPAEVVDISIDRDCFLYIMKNYLRLSWRGEQIPEKRRPAKDAFNEALIILGAKLCKADGRISREEISRFKNYFKIDESSFPGAGKIFKDAASTAEDYKAAAAHVAGLFRGNVEPLEYILFGLMQIAAADGVFDETENDFVRNVATEFGFSHAQTDRLFSIFGRKHEQTNGENSNSHFAGTTNTYISHLQVLGLTGDVTFEEIKRAYRTLARKHHPDLLHSQGVSVEDIADAEEVLKIINSAYEWLVQYHQESTGEPARSESARG